MSPPLPAADGGEESRRGDHPARRAERLLRWYPRTWRDRYGEEFAELLVSDIEERPQAPGRTLDVVRGGLVARLSAAGVCGLPLRDPGAMAPLGQAAAVISAAIVVRRAALSARVLAFETRLAAAACTVMIGFLAGCSCWVATGGQSAGAQRSGGQPGLFHAGLIDVAGIAVLAVALATALQAARTARRGLGLARG